MATTEQVRDAVLDVVLRLDARDLDYDSLSQRTGFSLEDIRSFSPEPAQLLLCVMQPFIDAIDERLKVLPMHSYPTPEQQREIFDAFLTASMEQPRLQALGLRLLTSGQEDPLTEVQGRAAYQIAIRLIGVEFGENTIAMTRVGFAIQMLATCVASQRRTLTSPPVRQLLLDSLVSAMNPSIIGRAPQPE